MRYDSFWTRRYRFWTRVWRRFRNRDLLSLALFGCATWLAALGKDLRWSIPIILAYALFTFWRAWLTFRDRESRFAAEGLVVGGLFDFINKELFSRSNRTRFTLFCEAPLRRTHIIPWYRFRRGGRGPIQEAETSRARYRPGEGLTGGAWENPAQNLVIQVLPVFQNRHEMELFYISALKVDPETARSISDYMIKVRGIVSYAYLDSRDQFLGLLSLDLKGDGVRFQPVVGELGEDRTELTISAEGEVLRVSGHSLFLLTRAVGNVLESFRLAERKALYE